MVAVTDVNTLDNFGSPTTGTTSPLAPTTSPLVTQQLAPATPTTSIDPSQSTLSPNFAPYVYNMLGQGAAAASLPFQPYTGQRYADTSPLQQQAFEGFGQLGPSAGTQAGVGAAQTALTGLQGLAPYQAGNISTGLGPIGSVSDYMNPYMQGVVDIQKREAQRQADITRQADQARLAHAGAYGGSRQAMMDAERERNLGVLSNDIQEKGSQSAYDRALAQRQQEAQLGVQAQQLGEQSRQFGAGLGLQGLNAQLTGANTLGTLGGQQFGQGLQALQAQQNAGETQQAIAQKPLDFGYQQFQDSMKYPNQQATFMQSLLQGLPLQAATYQPAQDPLTAALGGGLSGMALWQSLFGTKP
jgi:hypothetical protein